MQINYDILFGTSIVTNVPLFSCFENPLQQKVFVVRFFKTFPAKNHAVGAYTACLKPSFFKVDYVCQEPNYFCESIPFIL